MDAELDLELESQLTESIPRFNLADQILAEQRKVASNRRRRPSSASATPSPAPAVTGTVGRIITEVKNNHAANVEKTRPRNTDITDSPSRAIFDDHNVSDVQRQIIADIVAENIAHFFGDTSRAEPVWQSYVGN